MSIDTQASLVECLYLPIVFALPSVLFLCSTRWPFFLRLLLGVLVPWVLVILIRAFVEQPIEEAYYSAHLPNLNDREVVGEGYEEVGGNVAVAFCGLILPLFVCLLTAAASLVVRRIRHRSHPRSQAA